MSGLSSLYHHLSEVYNEMKEGLFSYFGNAYLTTFAPIDQLEKTVSELKTKVSIEEETTEETTEQEEDRDEI